MACCGSRKKQLDLIPKEVDALKNNPKYKDYSTEELMSYFYEFRAITQNSDQLNKEQFYELIRAFNVTSKAVLYRASCESNFRHNLRSRTNGFRTVHELHTYAAQRD